MPYQQSEYGQPYGQPAPPKSTSPWAIAALVLGVIGAVLFSVICGIVALGKTKDGQQGGRGLAIAGLILSGLWVVIGGAIAAVVLLVGNDRVIATDLEAGSCITDVPTSARVVALPTVDCAEPHGGEVYAVLTMPDGDYPGAATIDEWQSKCPDALAEYSPEAMLDDSVGVYVLYPTQETWDTGDRAVTCIATLDPKRAGTLKE
jgi:hypothetical protein